MLMRQKEYASYREVSQQYISKCIKLGKIKPKSDGRIDQEEADAALMPRRTKRPQQQKKSNVNHSVEIDFNQALDIYLNKLATEINGGNMQYYEFFTSLVRRTEYDITLADTMLNNSTYILCPNPLRQIGINKVKSILDTIPCSKSVKSQIEKVITADIDDVLDDIQKGIDSGW